MHLANEPKPTLNVATGCTVAVILPKKITLFCFKIPLLLSKDTGWLEMEKDKDTASRDRDVQLRSVAELTGQNQSRFEVGGNTRISRM